MATPTVRAQALRLLTAVAVAYTFSVSLVIYNKWLFTVCDASDHAADTTGAALGETRCLGWGFPYACCSPDATASLPPYANRPGGCAGGAGYRVDQHRFPLPGGVVHRDDQERHAGVGVAVGGAERAGGALAAAGGCEFSVRRLFDRVAGGVVRIRPTHCTAVVVAQERRGSGCVGGGGSVTAAVAVLSGAGGVPDVAAGGGHLVRPALGSIAVFARPALRRTDRGRSGGRRPVGHRPQPGRHPDCGPQQRPDLHGDRHTEDVGGDRRLVAHVSQRHLLGESERVFHVSGGRGVVSAVENAQDAAGGRLARSVALGGRRGSCWDEREWRFGTARETRPVTEVGGRSIPTDGCLMPRE
eukprot:ctg_2412.g447